MSAFIVEDVTINRIVNWVKHDSYKGAYQTNKLRQLGYQAPGFSPYDGVDPLWAEQLASDLFKLNCRAVNARYGQDQAKTFRALDFKYDPLEFAGSVQCLKSLDCLIYQCSEGNIPKDPLYQWLVQLSDHMAHTIVTHLPDFEKAEWD